MHAVAITVSGAISRLLPNMTEIDIAAEVLMAREAAIVAVESLPECGAWWDGAAFVAPQAAATVVLSASDIAADGADVAVLSGLPEGAYVRVGNDDYPAVAGQFVVGPFDEPGEVSVALVGPHTAGPWILQVRTLEDFKRAVRDRINFERDGRLNGGFLFGGDPYDTDERSRSFVVATAAGLGMGAALPEGFKWTTSDDRDIPMDAATFGAFAASMMAWGDAVHRHSRDLKTALEAIETAADLRAFDPAGGWPSNDATDYL